MAILGIVVGFVYVLAGVGKALDLDRFAATLVEISRISNHSARYLAAAVVLSEVMGGTFLMIKRTARSAAISLLFLTALFMWVLMSAILKGRPIECNCFGILNIGFPNHVELTIDFLLFNVLGIVAFCHGLRQHDPEGVGWGHRLRWWYILIAALIFYIEGEMLALAYSRIDRVVDNKTMTPLVQYARHRDARIGLLPGQRLLLFLLDFSDFACPPCFNDFMALCDSLPKLADPSMTTPVVGLMKPGTAFDFADQERLDEWTHASELRFRIFMAPDSLFVQGGFRRSCVLVIGSTGLVSEREEFPLGSEMRYKILDALR